MGHKTKRARSAYNRAYRQRHADRIRQQHREYRSTRSEFYRQQEAARCRAAKIEALGHYGGLACPCGEKRLGALTLDHIGGGGGKHRRESRCASGFKFYCWLRRHKYPPGYRVLCQNCNWREYRRLSEASWSMSAYAKRQRALKRKMKIRVMEKLGGKCVICGTDDIVVLTVHHIAEDGAAHRRILTNGASGHAFYCAILRSEDFTGLECRCFSCNDVAEWG